MGTLRRRSYPPAPGLSRTPLAASRGTVTETSHGCLREGAQAAVELPPCPCFALEVQCARVVLSPSFSFQRSLPPSSRPAATATTESSLPTPAPAMAREETGRREKAVQRTAACPTATRRPPPLPTPPSPR